MVGLRSVGRRTDRNPAVSHQVTQMVPGEMTLRKDGQLKFLAVGEGLVEVTHDRVAILTDMAVAAERSMRRGQKNHGDEPKPGSKNRSLRKSWLRLMPH